MKPLKIFTVICSAVLCFAALSISASAVNTETKYLRGDANGDSFVSVYDVTVLQRHLADIKPISGADLTAADVDRNGLDIKDVTNIQRFLAEYENPYQVGEWVNEPATQPSTHWFKPGDNELPFILN